MNIKLQAEPTFRTICTIGKDEAKALVNIFDCIMDNEDGYQHVERILDYRIDNLIANLEQVIAELETYVSKKKEEAFIARIDSAIEDKIMARKTWAMGE